ncbi:hypothetical protein FYK90_07820, partial [Lactobacillus salivarius]|nr:hypothetical protein [Ligilactobacillus salivarius]
MIFIFLSVILALGWKRYQRNMRNYLNFYSLFGKEYPIMLIGVRQLPQSKDIGLVAHDLTVSGNSATSLLPHY